MNQSFYKLSQTCILFFMCIFMCGCVSTSTRVMVKAWSAEDYQRSMPDGEGPEPEIYVFAQGEFEAGSIRDDSLLTNTDFVQVAAVLKESLAKQNYVNAELNQEVDLAIFVYWGQTDVQEETIYYDVEFEDGVIEEMEIDQITEKSLRRNSLILGNADKLYDTRRHLDREEVIATASDERYYFVLIAYDYRDLVQEKKKTIRWVTQFSVDTTGTNYLDALPAMTRVASQYYGKNIEKIEFTKAHLGSATVEFGEIEVIGSEKD